MPTVGIIGSGIAGIATSIRLANKGYDVQVYEANSYPGGKLSEIRVDDFRFDAGPSLFTLPELVDELFILSGKEPKSHFSYKKLPVSCHYFFEDRTFIKAYSDPQKLADEIHEKTGESKNTVLTALSKSSFLYESLSDLFMFRSLNDWKTFVNGKAFRAYSRIHRLDFFRTLDQANQAQFKEPRIIQMFNRYATYNGSSPYKTPATMYIIPNLEFNKGAFFPTSGMHSITLSLVELAKDLGVQFYFDSPVEQILLDGKKASGLKVAGERLPFDRIVSNMDMVNTYHRLLPDIQQPKRLMNQPKSSSALIFYWGIRKEFPELDLHNIFFSDNYPAEFEAIFDSKTLYHDPTVYVNITSKMKKDDAPEGCENWFTMINTPNNDGQDWSALIAKARSGIQAKLSRILREDISQLIVCEEILDPVTIEMKTSSSQGALYGNSSNNRFAAFLRHANKSSRIKNLFFCGGSVHPGGGIPLSLSSAKIVADLM